MSPPTEHETNTPEWETNTLLHDTARALSALEAIAGPGVAAADAWLAARRCRKALTSGFDGRCTCISAVSLYLAAPLGLALLPPPLVAEPVVAVNGRAAESAASSSSLPGSLRVQTAMLPVTSPDTITCAVP